VKADAHLQKALQLDCSIALAKVRHKYDPSEDLSLYQRPSEKYLIALRDKVKLKLNVYAEAKDTIEKVILDLESAQISKYENTKIDILQKCLGSLVSLQDAPYYEDAAEDLVEEETAKRRLKHA
jgi:hypothetical protein